jgi:RNA polymerase sigma factor (sigma-70 family)
VEGGYRFMDVDDPSLISQFARSASQQAFATLVERHVSMVYSAARRQLGGDHAAAEDATQQVFILLAQKAASLPPGTHLSAWLFKTTRYVCANARRKEQRRALHERKAAQMKSESHEPCADAPAWREIAPLLDEAIDALPAGEKSLVLSRFFEKRSFKEMGEQLRISEEAARKRVERATEKLRAFFARAGVASVPAAAPLAAALFENAVTQAPAALATLVSTQAIGAAAAAAATSTGTATGTWGSIMATAAGKKAAAVIGAALLVGGTAAVVVPAINKPSATPAARQVTVPLPPMSVTTRTGVVLELLGVSSPAEGDPWWQADGSPLPGAPFVTPDWLRTEVSRREFPGQRPMARFEFAFRARYADPAKAPTEHVFLQPAFQPNNNELMWETPNQAAPKDPGLSRMLAGWELPAPQTVKVTVGVAAGPWTTMAQTTTPLAQTEHTPRPEKPDLKMIFRPAVVEDPKENPSYAATTRPGAATTRPGAATTRPGAAPTTLPTYTRVDILYAKNPWTYGIDRPDIRVIATTTDGKELVTEHRRSGPVNPIEKGREWGDIYAFPTSPEKIASIRWQIRQYEPVVFENVSLRGGIKTEPKVTLKGLGEPLMPPPKRRR